MPIFAGPSAPVLAPVPVPVPMIGFNFKGGASMKPRCNSKCNASLVFFPHKPTSIASLNMKSRGGASLKSDRMSLGDVGLTSSCLSTTASSLLTGDHANCFTSTIPVLPRRRAMRTVVLRASKGIPYSFRYSSMTEKPRWWWRTLACIPYIMPLHVMSIYAEGAYQFLPFLEKFEILADPVSGRQLPSWFAMVYCLGVYFLIVRRKECPQFLRFHVIMAILLENALQVTAIVVSWMPYWTKLDTPFWTVFACGFLFMLLGCLRSALRGMYADIPYLSDAAHMHVSI